MIVLKKKITNKKDFLLAIQREKERRKKENKDQEKKLAQLEIEKQKQLYKNKEG